MIANLIRGYSKPRLILPDITTTSPSLRARSSSSLKNVERPLSLSSSASLTPLDFEAAMSATLYLRFFHLVRSEISISKFPLYDGVAETDSSNERVTGISPNL